MIGFFIIIFLASCLILFWSGSRLIKALMRIACFLGWREFVVAFFAMAFAASLPNLFVGLNSAFRKIPQLSFGDIVGGNMIDLTLAVALAVLIGRAALPAKSRLVQTSTIFTVLIALLPLVLVIDGFLGRGDGLILISAYFLYLFWLFSKKERFKKIYNKKEAKNKKDYGLKGFFKDLGRVGFSLILLLLASEGIVRSAQGFSNSFNLTLPIVGIFIVGAGNAIPETYFAIVSARRKQTWMILGDLMGSVISATSVLGIVALVSPIVISDFSPFAIARIFLVVSAVFFFIMVRSGQKVSKKEAVFLLFVYLLFLAAEIFFK